MGAVLGVVGKRLQNFYRGQAKKFRVMKKDYGYEGDYY